MMQKFSEGVLQGECLGPAAPAPSQERGYGAAETRADLVRGSLVP